MTERVYLICEWSDIESGGLCVYDAPRSCLDDIDALKRMLQWIEIDDVQIHFVTSDITSIGDHSVKWKLEDELQHAITRNIDVLKKYVGWMKNIEVRVVDGTMRFQARTDAKQYSNWLRLVRSKSESIMKYKRYLKSIS